MTEPATTATVAEIRAWAKEQGLPVGTRGSISATIREAYAAR